MILITYYFYYGGKIRMISEITLLIPFGCTKIVDCFGGSGAITINRAPSIKNAVLNELNPEIANLHQLMANPETQDKLIQRLQKIDYDKQLFDIALKFRDDNYAGLSDIEKAAQTFTLLTQSFNACMESFSNPKTAEDMREKQRNYKTKLLYNLPRLPQRYAGVTVTCENAYDLIKKYKNDPNVLLHIDCPYLWDTRALSARKAYGKNGMYELSRSQHKRLLKLIKNAKCKIILYGYWSNLYENKLAFSKKTWYQFILKVVPKSSQQKGAGIEKDMAFEYCWINYEPPEIAKRNIIGFQPYSQITKI